MRTPPDRKATAALKEERRKKVAANLVAGLNYRDMADALDVSISTIASDVKIILQRWRDQQVESINDWMAVELRRLDRATNAIWAEVQDGNLSAIDRLIKIMERRTRYLGLDVPEKREHTGADGGPVQVAHQTSLANLTVEDLKDLERILSKYPDA